MKDQQDRHPQPQPLSFGRCFHPSASIVHPSGSSLSQILAPEGKPAGSCTESRTANSAMSKPSDE